MKQFVLTLWVVHLPNTIKPTIEAILKTREAQVLLSTNNVDALANML